MTRLLRPLLVVVAALAAFAGGCLVLVSRAGGHGTGLAPAAAAPTPATAPMTAATTVPPTTAPPAPTTTTSPAAARLAAQLDVAMAGTNGCLIAADGATVLYASNPAGSFAPASTQKLLVAAAALSQLGPDFRFVTTVVASEPPKAGAVTSLWLVGGGDPLLATPEFIAYDLGQPREAGYPFTPLAALADALAGAGFRTVSGGVHGDSSRNDPMQWLPVWPQSYKVQQDIGPLSALTVNEGIALSKPVSKLAADPAALASSELARLLVARHVAATGGADATAPAGGVVVAQVTSVPLSEIIKAMLRASDNLIAEMLVRELDRQTGGRGTTAGGLAVVLKQGAALGLPMGQAHLDDGSGLAPTDRATCPLLLAALDLSAKPGLQAIGQGLAVAGQSGTLVHRFNGTALAGKLSAKTGSIAGVAGIVGVVDVTRPVRFALLINQPVSYAALIAVEDRVIHTLAAYPG